MSTSALSSLSLSLSLKYREISIAKVNSRQRGHDGGERKDQTSGKALNSAGTIVEKKKKSFLSPRSAKQNRRLHSGTLSDRQDAFRQSPAGPSPSHLYDIVYLKACKHLFERFCRCDMFIFHLFNQPCNNSLQLAAGSGKDESPVWLSFQQARQMSAST